MSTSKDVKIGLLIPGDVNMKPEESRVHMLYTDLMNAGVNTKVIPYSHTLVDKIEENLISCNVLLVWVNPIHDGKDRTVLDDLLTRVSENGVLVSTHPEVILKMGTKDILYNTRKMAWGSDVRIYKTFEDFTKQFLASLKERSRVLKQYRGNGGIGIWRVDRSNHDKVKVLHAVKGSLVREMKYLEFLESMKQYFTGSGHLIDQEFQPRLAEGMIRCYMSLDKVIGFGFQYVTALLHPENEKPLDPEPREYFSKEEDKFQDIRKLLENDWINEMQQILEIKKAELPLLWDADFLLGTKTSSGEDTYVLCEVNVSSVYPYPESGNDIIIKNIQKLIAEQ